ncbi:MAG: MBL fold metallo-hydrolase [Clostridia bacterium]|nr:MBL fold metallo-hydrolase [Clostridia bacterium]
MRIVNGVEMLELSMDVMGKTNFIYPVLVWDCDNVLLIDAGYPGQSLHIKDAMSKAGIPLNNLTKIIITHHDMDHIGSILGIQNELGIKAEILAHKEEKPYIQGEQCPIKIAQMEARFESLPPEAKVLCKNMKSAYQKYSSHVDKTIEDNEELPVCGGINIIHTPGHTPGHISLYLKQFKILIAGDSMFAEGGTLTPAPVFTNSDNDMALKSLEKLTQFDIETVICYHGGIFKDNANKRIAELANNKE